jgi:hypothetical protein
MEWSGWMGWGESGRARLFHFQRLKDNQNSTQEDTNAPSNMHSQHTHGARAENRKNIQPEK